MPEVPLGTAEEVPGEPVVLGLRVLDPSYPRPVQAEQHRAGVGEEDARVRGAQELGVAGGPELVDDADERELPLRRARGLRLVQDAARLLEAVHEQRE